jgi:hypothetical protein
MELNARIVGAMCIGVALVGGAWLATTYAPGSPASGGEPAALTAAPTPEALPARAFIPVSDTDGDTIPDWQNQFDVPTVTLDGQPDPERANTLTSQAARSLAQSLVGSDGQGLTGAPNLVAAELAREMADEVAVPQYTADDMLRGADTPAAWRTYGNRVAAITFENQVTGQVEYELVLLDRALAFRSEAALADLARLATSYEAMAAAMLTTPAPPGLMDAHVSLTNSYAALAADIAAFSKALDDPLLATVHFGRYPENVDRLYTSIITLYTTLDAAGITWQPGDPAYELIAVSE